MSMETIAYIIIAACVIGMGLIVWAVITEDNNETR